jgi:transposase
MRPKGSAEELQKRRFQAIRLLNEGYGPTEVSRIVQVDLRTVFRWRDRFQESGKKGLQSKPHPGRRPKLTARQKDKLADILIDGPTEAGFSTDLWNGPRVARVIRRAFGIRYHPRHMPRLLRSLGWSPQRPERKAYERDERAYRRWLRDDWSGIKKSPAG